MATFITLVRFTARGVADFRKSPQRAEFFRTLAEEAGGRVKDVYWTLGAHDGVLIFEAPDEEAATALMLSLAASGNVTTQTLCAFDQAQFESIIAGTP